MYSCPFSLQLLTAQELWPKQLLLLKRVTREKALAIVKEYPTCQTMIDWQQMHLLHRISYFQTLQLIVNFFSYIENYVFS